MSNSIFSGGAVAGVGVPTTTTSAEDELWHLLDVIQRKGTRLRQDLERAEIHERERGHTSDPPTPHVTPHALHHPHSHHATRFNSHGMCHLELF